MVRRAGRSVVSLILLAARKVEGDEFCKFSAAGYSYNLCGLADEELAMCKPGGFEGTEACYSLAPLRNVRAGCQGVPTPAVESLSTGLGQGCRVLGSLSERLVVPDPYGNGVQILYQGGDACGVGARWATLVNMRCAPGGSTSYQKASLISTPVANKCNYTFEVSSAHACPTEMGLIAETEHMIERQGGYTRMLLLVMALAASYVAGGSYYKAKVLGFYTFPDYIPHVGFWQSYPGLVLDGAKWTLQMVTGSGVPEGDFLPIGSQHGDRRNVFRDTFKNFVPTPASSASASTPEAESVGNSLL